MTNKKVRDLLAMIEVISPNELKVNSWWGTFVKDYKEALQMAIEALEQKEKSEYEHDHEVVKAYNDGQAYILDKIRAEIENDWQFKQFPRSPWSCGLRRALEIIDKYRGE